MRKQHNISPIGPYNPLKSILPAGATTSISGEQFEAAVVVDVIVNNDHSSYATDGYNIGCVKFRKLNSNSYRSESDLLWAFPFDSHIVRYPLVGEIVFVFSTLNRWYYFNNFNISNRPTTHEMLDLITETGASQTDAGKVNLYKASTAPNKIGPSKQDVGKYFRDQADVYAIKPFEGDVILQGRSGQSIRFGSSWLDGRSTSSARETSIPWQSTNRDQSPNLILRIGRGNKTSRTTNSMFGRVVEDINADDTSIWMVSDQIVPIKLATSDSRIHKFSVQNFPTRFDGNQLFLNSDRVVINSKRGEIIGSAHGNINWMTLSDHTVDVEGDSLSYVGRDHGLTVGNDRLARIVGDDSTIVEGNISSHTNKNLYFTSSDKIYLGSNNRLSINSGELITIKSPKVIIGGNESDEPIVCGLSLAAFLGALIDAFIGNGPTPSPTASPGLNAQTFIATTGAPGLPSPLNPIIVQNLLRLKRDVLNGGGTFASFNSKVGFVRKTP